MFKVEGRPWLGPSINQVNPDRETSKITLNSTSFSLNLTHHLKKLVVSGKFGIMNKVWIIFFRFTVCRRNGDEFGNS